MEKIIIKIDKAKLILYLLTCLMFFVISLMMFLEIYENNFNDSSKYKGIPVTLLSIGGIVFFGIGVFVFLFVFFRNKRLEITDKIKNYSGLFKTKEIDLEDVKKIELGFVNISHPFHVYKSKPYFVRVIFKESIGGKNVYNIGANLLNINSRKLVEILNQRLKEYNSIK